VALLVVIGKGWIDAYLVFPSAPIVSARSIAGRSRWPQTVQSFPFFKINFSENYELQSNPLWQACHNCHAINYWVRNDSRGRRNMEQLVPARSRPA
jgi:hypothetical protein